MGEPLSEGSQRRRAGLRVYLASIAAVPLAAMVLFAASGIRSSAIAADRAARVGRNLDRYQATLGLERAAALEGFYSTLIVRIDRTPTDGLDRAALSAALGGPIDGLLREQRSLVDQAIVRRGLSLAGGEGAIALSAGTFAELTDLRQRLDRREASVVAVDAYFERLREAAALLSEQSAGEVAASSTGSAALGRYFEAWRNTAALERTSLDQIVAIVGVLAPGNQWLAADTPRALAGALKAERGQWQLLELSVPSRLAGDLQLLQNAEATLAFADRAADLEAWAGVRADPQSAVAPASVRLRVLGEALARLPAQDALAEAAAELIGDAAASTRASATVDVTAQLVLALGTATVTIIAFLSSRRWLVEPLRNLAAGARALAHSAVESKRVTVTGPPEVAAVGQALTELTYELAVAEAQAAAISVANWQAPILGTPSHMAIGVSLRQAMQTLTGLVGQLRSRERIAQAVFDNSAEPVWAIDEHGIVRNANKATQEFLGWSVESIIGISFSQLLATEADRASFELMREVGAVRGELQLRHCDGRGRPALMSGAVTSFENELLMTVIAHDIADRKELEGRLAHQANHDTLTGLPNRAAAVAHLERALLQANIDITDTALLFVDLDRFKLVNDSHGHRGGDGLLGAVAARMRELASPTVLAARLGGDEFVVVLSRTQSLDAVIDFGHRLIAAIEQPYVINGITHTISASVGICYAAAGKGSAIGMLRDADHAVYQAKQRGGACVQVFDEELREAVDMRARTEVDLRRAIERDELVLHYQPIVETATGALRGVESLVRWQHPTRGLILPDSFIPLAEESMLIADLGRWVLGAAARQVAEWQALPGVPPFSVSVNLSGRHIVDADVVADVTAVLAATGADPHRLKIEVTESRLISEIDSSSRTFQRLRELGIGISIDDFGTGYSGFTNVRSFPIDQVKIDRSFVRNLGLHHQDTAIVETVINLARAFGIDVVAEGVETDEQRRHLAARGCSLIQGWLVAPSMSDRALIQWMDRDLPALRRRFDRSPAVG